MIGFFFCAPLFSLDLVAGRTYVRPTVVIGLTRGYCERATLPKSRWDPIREVAAVESHRRTCSHTYLQREDRERKMFSYIFYYTLRALLNYGKISRSDRPTRTSSSTVIPQALKMSTNLHSTYAIIINFGTFFGTVAGNLNLHRPEAVHRNVNQFANFIHHKQSQSGSLNCRKLSPTSNFVGQPSRMTRRGVSNQKQSKYCHRSLGQAATPWKTCFADL